MGHHSTTTNIDCLTLQAFFKLAQFNKSHFYSVYGKCPYLYLRSYFAHLDIFTNFQSFVVFQLWPDVQSMLNRYFKTLVASLTT